MRPWLALSLFLFAGRFPLPGHETITTKITWSAEISRIFEKRCIRCHGGGANQPMALTSYAEARPWAVAIREEVLERRMPPWSAVKGFGEFKDDESLTDEEIQRIAEWVTGGAPEGDPALLPPMRSAPWKPAKPVGRSISVRDGSVLAGGVTVAAIQPVAVPVGTTVRVVAQLPDGSMKPMLWLRGNRPASRAYVYREPVRLLKGTRMRVYSPVPIYFRLFAKSLSDR